MKRITLGDIATISSGGTPDRQRPDFWNGAIPWVKTGEIQFNIIRDTEEKITDSAIRGSSTKVYSAGTLLMAMYGQGKTRGQVAVLDIDAAINQACAAIIPSDKEDTRYLFQYLAYQYSNIRGLSNSGSQENLNAELIRSIPVYYPEKSCRNKIADILSTWDESLVKLDALIAAKERRKRGLMQQLLTGKRRVKGFSGKWERTTFGALLHESRNPGSHGLIAHKITVKLYGKGVYAKQERLVGSENTKYFVRHAGQFIYSKLDFLNGAFGIVPPFLDGFESTQDLPAFDVAKKCDARWLLAYVVRPEFYTRQLGAAAGGRKARRVNPPEFLELPVGLPDLPEQRAIADILVACDDELRLLHDQRAAIDRQKRGLMQKLLAGIVRVNV